MKAIYYKDFLPQCDRFWGEPQTGVLIFKVQIHWGDAHWIAHAHFQVLPTSLAQDLHQLFSIISFILFFSNQFLIFNGSGINNEIIFWTLLWNIANDFVFHMLYLWIFAKLCNISFFYFNLNKNDAKHIYRKTRF